MNNVQDKRSFGESTPVKREIQGPILDPLVLCIVAISTRSMDGGDTGFNAHLRSLIMASTNFEMIPYKAIRIIPVVE
jgi:hypothetical protein